MALGIYCELLKALKRGESVALLRLIASSGSVPRGAGANMLLFASGKSLGSIGGGEAEFRALQKAGELLLSHGGETLHFSLYPGGAGELGMVCGGSVSVSVVCFSPGDEAAIRLFTALLEAVEEGQEAHLITSLEKGAVRDMGLYTKKEGLRFSRTIPEASVLPLLKQRPVLTDTEPALYAEPISLGGFAWIFGGGHVSQELVPLLSHLDFRVKVLEDRADFADPDRFPGAAEVLLCDFSDFESRISLKPGDYALIMTRGHASDYAILRRVLHYPLRYVGMIGSRYKVGATMERLRGEGFAQEELDRIFAPIGLAIGAKTPAEIAVSILAQVIQEKNKAFSSCVTREMSASREPGMLLVILDKQGSAPRGVGSMMLVTKDGSMGSVGGGASEYAALCEAREGGGVRIRDYHLNSAQSAQEGMICGGSCRVLFIPV